jgi:hypothetical protein
MLHPIEPRLLQLSLALGMDALSKQQVVFLSYESLPSGSQTLSNPSINPPAKELVPHGPAPRQDIHETVSCIVDKRSNYCFSVIMGQPLKFIHFLSRCCPGCFMIVFIEHPRLITSPEKVEVGGCMAFRRLSHASGHLPMFRILPAISVWGTHPIW